MATFLPKETTDEGRTIGGLAEKERFRRWWRNSGPDAIAGLALKPRPQVFALGDMLRQHLHCYGTV